MADESGAITIYISPKTDDVAIADLRRKLEDALNVKVDFKREGAGESGGGMPGESSRKADETEKSVGETLKDYISKDENKRKLTVAAIKSTEVAVSSSLKKGFSIVEDIYARLKQASPLLQAIESLFQIAMTLLFMPLGNKLGELLIPATLDLLDNVIKIWDSFEGKSLGDMFGIAMNQGVKMFGEYFTNLGDTLVEQGGHVANIGRLLQTLGAFIEGPAVGVLNGILNVTTFVLANFKHFVSLWVAMKAAEISMNTVGLLGEAVGVKTAIGATALVSLAAFGTSEALMSGWGMEKGGYVPATPGGSLRVLGEAGRGEYVIPEDQRDSIGGSTIINNFYGYNEDQLVEKINEVTSQNISQSRLRSGF